MDASPEDIYRAACRVAMRLVVILFAESRDLLPNENNALYHDSYGLNGLLEELERDAARGSPLTREFRRMAALTRLVLTRARTARITRIYPSRNMGASYSRLAPSMARTGCPERLRSTRARASTGSCFPTSTCTKC